VSFAFLANVVTAILCVAVIVQSVRMMRSLKELRGGAILEVVQSLDRSTAQARQVLSELRVALADCGPAARTLNSGKAIADELSVMIGLADASADRLTSAADAARHRGPDAADAARRAGERA